MGGCTAGIRSDDSEGESDGAGVGDGLEKDHAASFFRAFAGVPLRRRPDRYTFTTGGPHSHRATISGTRFRTLAHAQRRFPVAVLRVGRITWWAFRGEVYRDDRGRDARAVHAAIGPA